MNSLLRYNFGQKYLVIDTETEHLNLINAKTWQVAWLVGQGKDVISKRSYHLKIPDLNVSPEAAKVTGFVKSEHDRVAVDPKKVWDELAPLLYSNEYLVIGQNILAFDVYMLNIWQRLIGLPSDFSYLPRVLDTKALAVAVFKDLSPQGDRLEWQYKLLHVIEKGLKTSEKTLLQYYKIPFDEHKLHDALYDIEKCFEIFQKQIWDIKI